MIPSTCTGGVVKMLLGRGDVNLTNGGQTPLSWAAEYGHAGMVNILLGREDVNPGKPDKLGRTPFWHASKHVHPEVIVPLQHLASTTGTS